MWNLKDVTTNLSTEQTHNIENRSGLAKVEEGQGGKDYGFGNSRCKLLCTGLINKGLLYSTGNDIEYPVINHNEEYERECTHIYMYN